jgi:hypothetical protein
MTLVPNRPTAQGRGLGKQLAMMADKAEAEFTKLHGKTKERCRSCAFRGGTLPNGCEETLMDAIKCVMEGEPFYCHETKGDDKPLCAGWYVAQAAVIGRPKMETPWKFSHELATESECAACGTQGRHARNTKPIRLLSWISSPPL